LGKIYNIVLIAILICMIAILSGLIIIKADVIILDPYSTSVALVMQIFMGFIGLFFVLCFLQFGLYLKIKGHIKISSRRKSIAKSFLSIFLFIFGFISLILLLYY